MSVVNECPEDLHDAMRHFVRTHRNLHWGPVRLMLGAVADFILQQGSRERADPRQSLDGLLDRGTGAQLATECQEGRGEPDWTLTQELTLWWQQADPAWVAGPRRPAAPQMPHDKAHRRSSVAWPERRGSRVGRHQS